MHYFFSDDAKALGIEKPKFHPDCRIHGYHRADVRDYCDTDYELGLIADPANYPFDCEACAETQVMTNVVPIVSIFPLFIQIILIIIFFNHKLM